ncbi:major royal jelly protein [Viridothelium virens]|uniref:Major royal jelly protein n=1 Tax=Viridothelium virens TaxID=1048519 RepID=A0A6A6GWB4_VIRVR|nr:major royal jelly protein [Viridothelium virens]
MFSLQAFIVVAYGLGSLSGSKAQTILSDPGVAGPPVEIVHLYYDEWPTGIAVSASGRKFSNYPPALDPTDLKYTVAELNSNNTETPYPSLEINSPPGGRINYTTTPPTGANYQNYFIGVQSVVVDPADRLWVLDTGRAATPNGTMVPAAYGGPKLVGINLQDNSIIKTIIFSPTAAPSTSYLNDIRFDLTPSLTPSGQGVAYITDSSSEGTNALITVDLGSGAAWRHLVNIPAVEATEGFVPTIWGQPVYSNGTTGQPISNVNFGADGIALSADGATLYFSTTGGRRLYAVPTARLRDDGPNSEVLARASQVYLTGKGLTDGMESDSQDNIYMGNIEDNSISIYTPATGLLSTFVRDPRFSWTDTMSVAADGYLYFTENQLWRGAAYNGGVDKRVKPYVLFRVKLPGNGTKVTQPAP